MAIPLMDNNKYNGSICIGTYLLSCETKFEVGQHPNIKFSIQLHGLARQLSLEEIELLRLCKLEQLLENPHNKKEKKY